MEYSRYTHNDNIGTQKMSTQKKITIDVSVPILIVSVLRRFCFLNFFVVYSFYEPKQKI